MDDNLLLYKRKNTAICGEFVERAAEYCEGYKTFINKAKTEREAVKYAEKLAADNGFVKYEGQALKSGDKVYYTLHGKLAAFAVIGKQNFDFGIRTIISHIDSPRLDLKQVPLYEDKGIAYFKTHYYGGVKKYQWTALPLSLHGVIVKSDGTTVDVCIGDREDEAVFYITDLMPHIAKDQMDKPLRDAITGEGLNIICGTTATIEKENAVKLAVLNALYEKYGVTERDLITAELCAVPALNARDVGFDRSMIAAYGHDDRICAYPSLTALFNLDNTPERTVICVLADKEEIGSVGVTGMDSETFKNLLLRLCASTGGDYFKCIENSICLSADVGGAYDPCYSEAYEYNNSPRINHGIALVKYTGSRGKSGSNDASAELVAKIASIFDKNGIAWQSGEYGKVDQGGAGTVASEIAKLGMEVIDAGVPILSMHAPIELAAKTDIYSMHLACEAFYKD